MVLQLVYIHNTAITAATDIFTAIAPSQAPSTFRVYVTLGTSGILSVQRTNTAGGGGTVTENLNTGTALVANAAYVFDVLVAGGDTITLRSTASGTLLTLIVREIPQ